jgi:AcrR family transcriptional regulator
MATRRKYELKKRAERLDEVRWRIVDAAIGLHAEIGPAQTTVTEIARRAEVGRLTVYRHFPDEESLYRACGERWLGEYPPPDPQRWLETPDPALRTRLALAELYEYYALAGVLLANVIRDAAIVPPLRVVLDENLGAIAEQMRDALVHGWSVRGRRRARLRAVLGLVLAFQTWQSLADEGLTTEEAADVATDLVRASAPVEVGAG